MSGLPNLQRLIDWPDAPADSAALIAAAPAMAQLLIACVNALQATSELALWEPGRKGYAAAETEAIVSANQMLARLADFDQGIA